MQQSPGVDQFTHHHLPAQHNTDAGSRPQRESYQWIPFISAQECVYVCVSMSAKDTSR